MNQQRLKTQTDVGTGSPADENRIRWGKYIKPYLPFFILGPILMIVEVIGEVVLPKFMANIINIGAANHDVPYIIGMGVVMVITALLMMAGGVGGAYFAAKAAISWSIFGF